MRYVRSSTFGTICQAILSAVSEDIVQASSVNAFNNKLDKFFDNFDLRCYVDPNMKTCKNSEAYITDITT